MSIMSDVLAAAAAASISTLHIRPANEHDIASLVGLINEAYEVETGDSGVAFKKTERIVRLEEVSHPTAEGRVLVAQPPGGSIVGTIFFEHHHARPSVIGFGPFAVATAAQGKGVGRALLTAIEALGKARCCTAIQLETVHHRTDLEPLYRRLGFVPIGEEPFVHLERITRPCHFIIWRRRLAPPPADEAEAQGMPHILHVLNSARALAAVGCEADAAAAPGTPSSGAGAAAAAPASGQRAPPLHLRMGRADDGGSDEAAVIRIVNEAYAIEEGSDGVAFKREGCKRLHGEKGRAEARAWLAAGRVIIAEGRLLHSHDSAASVASPATEAGSGSAASESPASAASAEARTPSATVLGVLVFGEGDVAAPAPDASEPARAIGLTIRGIHFGPFAVDARAQRRGVGAALLEAVEAHARARSLPVQIEVVNTRSDVLPMYVARGYKDAGALAWEALADRSVLTRDVYFRLLRREW